MRRRENRRGGVKSGSGGQWGETGREGCFIIDTIAAIETQETSLFLPLECGTSTCCKLVVVVVCLVAVWSFKSASHLPQPASPADICRLSINIVILTIIIVILIIITIILIITSSSSLWALCQRLSAFHVKRTLACYVVALVAAAAASAASQQVSPGHKLIRFINSRLDSFSPFPFRIPIHHPHCTM